MRLNDFKKGMKVIYFSDNPIDTFEEIGTVKEVFEDHIILDVPRFCDHIWIDEDSLNLVKLI